MNEVLLRVHTRLGAEFLHPEFGFYTDLPLAEREQFLATEQEVRNSITCATGSMAEIEDDALNISLNQEARAIGFALTHDEHRYDVGAGLLKVC